jgi:hypothetical protein
MSFAQMVDEMEQLARATHPDIVEGNAFGAHEAAQEQAAYAAELAGELAAEAAEKELDRNMATIPAPATVVEQLLAEIQDDKGVQAMGAAVVAQDEAAQVAAFSMPPAAYIYKGRRNTLIFEGVCSHCAHCGQPLTDAVSVERGIGPICSKKGYAEDPVQSDEIQALIDLAEFPALVDYITERYKPQGVRPMMNALVKICSLNRRSPVHPACCDAIESLGFARLASTLRESIAVVEIKDCKEHPGNYHVWVKKSDWHWGWSNAIRSLTGAFISRQLKGTIVPMRHKRDLWEMMLKFYGGLCAKTPDGKVIKIMRAKVQQQQDLPDVSASQAATSS